MNGVHVDRAARTVRVQGGATWADVDRETRPSDPPPRRGCVAYRGGRSDAERGDRWLPYKYGLSCDNLIAADVVTAQGDLLTASTTENPDLWWALRGGGGNFGTATSFVFTLHLWARGGDILPDASDGTRARGPKQWRDWAVSTPAQISEAALWTTPAVPELPAAVHDQDVVIPSGV